VEAETNVRDDAYGLCFKPDADFPNGVSGGPLVDPGTGAVVGLIKSRRMQRHGGMAVSLLALRQFGETYRISTRRPTAGWARAWSRCPFRTPTTSNSSTPPST